MREIEVLLSCMQNLFFPNISATLFFLLHGKPTKPLSCEGCADVVELQLSPEPCWVGHSRSVTPAWPAAPALCIVCHIQALQPFDQWVKIWIIPAVLVWIQYVPVINDSLIKGLVCAIPNRDVVSVIIMCTAFCHSKLFRTFLNMNQYFVPQPRFNCS